MAMVTVTVPDGEYCNGCDYLIDGTIYCKLFDRICEEIYGQTIKHDECPRIGEAIYEQLIIEG